METIPWLRCCAGCLLSITTPWRNFLFSGPLVPVTLKSICKQTCVDSVTTPTPW